MRHGERQQFLPRRDGEVQRRLVPHLARGVEQEQSGTGSAVQYVVVGAPPRSVVVAHRVIVY